MGVNRNGFLNSTIPRSASTIRSGPRTALGSSSIASAPRAATSGFWRDSDELALGTQEVADVHPRCPPLDRPVLPGAGSSPLLSPPSPRERPPLFPRHQPQPLSDATLCHAAAPFGPSSSLESLHLGRDAAGGEPEQPDLSPDHPPVFLPARPRRVPGLDPPPVLPGRMGNAPLGEGDGALGGGGPRGRAGLFFLGRNGLLRDLSQPSRVLGLGPPRPLRSRAASKDGESGGAGRVRLGPGRPG